MPQFADVCYLCGDDGEDAEMLVCDNCDYKVAHIKCLGLQKVPIETWVCEMCN